MIDTTRVRIEVAMVAQGLTARGLAERMGVKPMTVGSWMARGCSSARRDAVLTLARVAEALGVPLEALQPGGPRGPLVGE